MHELPVVENLIRTLDRQTEQERYKRILEVHLVVGELSGIVDECIETYFDMLSEGHSCENAILTFEHEPATLKCLKCGHEFQHGKSFACPSCGGDSRLLKGTGGGFLVKSIKAEM